MAAVHAAAFWITRYFSVGLRATRPLVRAVAVAWRVLRKEGAAAIRASWMAAATAPIGVMVFAMVWAAWIVAVTKPRKKAFHR